MTLITTACAVCGGNTFVPVYPATFPLDDPNPTQYFSSSRTKVGYLPIVRCTECGLVMSNPHDDDETLGKVYSALQDQLYDAEDENRRATAQEHLAFVNQFNPQKGRLLDVGCATGMFVSVAQQAGWQVTGLEASTWAITQAQQRAPQATLVNALLENAALPQNYFEVITLWDVLEHVRSPQETLQHISNWLKPNGWLFLNLPNVDSAPAKLMGKNWVLLLREHLWYFSPNTLGTLLSQNNIALQRTRPNWVRFSFHNILLRLGQYPNHLGHLSQHAAQLSLFKNFAFRFPIGEMTVAAQKLVTP